MGKYILNINFQIVLSFIFAGMVLELQIQICRQIFVQPRSALFSMVATRHMCLFKFQFILKKIKNLVSWLHQPHSKCSVVVSGQWLLNWTTQIQNMFFIVESYMPIEAYSILYLILIMDMCFKCSLLKSPAKLSLFLCFYFPVFGAVRDTPLLF